MVLIYVCVGGREGEGRREWSGRVRGMEGSGSGRGGGEGKELNVQWPQGERAKHHS